MKNANGQGTITYETDRKTYRAGIVDPTGKRIRKRFKTKTEADEWLTNIRSEIYKNEYIPVNDYTVGSWFQTYLKVYCKPKLKLTTMSNYISQFAKIEPIANYKLQSITTTQLQSLINNSPNQFGLHSFLKAGFNKALQIGLIAKNPMLYVEHHRKSIREINVFSKEEINTILSFCHSSVIYKKWYLFLLTAFSTGMRVGELIGLTPQCVLPNAVKVEQTVSFVTGSGVYVREPKTKTSKRTISIPPSLAKQLIEHSGHTYIFESHNHTPLNLRCIHRMFHKIQELAGITPVRNFHQIRHTHASQLLTQFSVVEVSHRLGHSKPSVTTDVYGHLIGNADQKIASKLSDFIDSNFLG